MKTRHSFVSNSSSSSFVIYKDGLSEKQLKELRKEIKTWNSDSDTRIYETKRSWLGSVGYTLWIDEMDVSPEDRLRELGLTKKNWDSSD
jgi:hypothetical protein